jgi:hypothetical protein
LVGKPKRKRLLGRLECRWEDIKMDLKEIGCKGVDWVYGQMVGSSNGSLGSKKCQEVLK